MYHVLHSLVHVVAITWYMAHSFTLSLTPKKTHGHGKREQASRCNKPVVPARFQDTCFRHLKHQGAMVCNMKSQVKHNTIEEAMDQCVKWSQVCKHLQAVSGWSMQQNNISEESNITRSHHRLPKSLQDIHLSLYTYFVMLKRITAIYIRHLYPAMCSPVSNNWWIMISAYKHRNMFFSNTWKSTF